MSAASTTVGMPSLATPAAIDNLAEQAWAHRYSQPEQTILLASQALQLAQTAGYALGMARLTRILGVAKALLSQFSDSLELLNSALEQFQKLESEPDVAAVKANLGATYQKMGQYDVALQIQLEILPLLRRLKLPDVESNTLSNIAEIYMETRQFALALDYEQRSIEIREVIPDTVGMAFGLGAIGRIYLGMEKLAKAEEYYARSLRYCRQLNNRAALAHTLRGMGEVLRMQNRSADAMDCLQEALDCFREIKDPQLISENLIVMAKAQVELGQPEAAEANANEALALAMHISDRATISDANDVLSRLAAHRADYKLAMKHHKLFTDMRVELMEHTNQQSLAFMEARFNFEVGTREREIFKLQSGEISRALSEVAEQERALQHEADELQASLVYAQRVQSGIVNQTGQLSRVFPRSWVYLQPKDYVSGDFFWCARTESQRIVAVGDCTGTGIPAALLSVVANSLLNQIVHQRNVTNPAKILGQLHNGFRKMLHQTCPRGATSTDSLDIAVVAVNNVSTEVNFAGAIHSLFMLKRGQLEELKGDRFTVGGPQQEAFRIYTNHRLVLQGNEQFILYTDGFANQMGGEQGKRFSTKRLRELIEGLAALPFDNQADYVGKTFTEWKGGHENTDDVLFLSFKV